MENIIEPDKGTDELAHAVIGAAIGAHRHLGPGSLQVICEEAVGFKLALRQIPFQRQKGTSIWAQLDTATIACCRRNTLKGGHQTGSRLFGVHLQFGCGFAALNRRFHTRSADLQSAVSQNSILQDANGSACAKTIWTACRLQIGDTADYKSALHRCRPLLPHRANSQSPRGCEMFGLSLGG